ncbi:MAG: hypothetical protein WB564_08435 [Dehalococcoidia bacterium]
MYGVKKIILSRKGFDSSSGGDYSPFDLATGKYIVLPIPQDEDEVKISNRQKFEEIKIKSNYFKEYNASNLKELIERVTKKGKAMIKKNRLDYAHFDPWLGHCPWLEEESNHSIGVFGQVDGAQTHLRNQEVEEGSLFLFFSRFKPTGDARENKLGINISAKHLKEGLYFIYGWLRVGWKPIQKFEEIDNIDILNAKEKEELRSHHPHATPEYFQNCKGKNNTIYIAHKYLLDNSTKFPGCSYFPVLSDKLLLTATDSDQSSDQSQMPNWLASRWKLPPGFSYQTCCSVLKNPAKWKTTNIVETSWHWQEAVFKESEEFSDWFKGLLEGMHK